ncbi:MAG: response regulator [Mariprofundaceae bacterium]|nr:response regulator [Mariprofundaceae bacterium]
MSRVRLLVVEDDEALAALLEEYLQEAGYDVELHLRGDTAMQALRSGQYDLVLTDLVLPGADGLSILREASGQPHKTLVMLMTGYSGIQDALDAVRQGAYDFVSKPFQLPEIHVRLDNAARYQALLRKYLAGTDTAIPIVRMTDQHAFKAYDAQHKNQ